MATFIQQGKMPVNVAEKKKKKKKKKKRRRKKQQLKYSKTLPETSRTKTSKTNGSDEVRTGLNVADVRRDRIPLLWSTIRERAFAKGFTECQKMRKTCVYGEERSCLEGVYTMIWSER